MLVGCAQSWPAASKWDPIQFQQRFSNDSVFRAFQYVVGKPEFMTTERSYLWETILTSKVKRNRGSGDDPHYYISHRLKGNDSLLHEFGRPPQFPSAADNLLNYVSALNAKYYPYSFLYYGETDSSSPIHTDFVGTDAWNTLFHGSKWWALIPPSVQDKAKHFRCEETCSSSVKGDAWFASVGRYIDQFRGQGGHVGLQVLQQAGETLYIPNEWYHTTLSIGAQDTIAVSTGFLSEFNFQAFWQQAVRVATVQEQARLYYTILTKPQRQIVRGFARRRQGSAKPIQ